MHDARVDGRRLATLDVLAGCSADDLEPVAARMTVRSLAPGDVLMREGQPADVFALVLEGEVVITRGEGSRRRAARPGRSRFDPRASWVCCDDGPGAPP